jgi:2-methylcitrate dehydratase PrpD
MIKEHKFRPDQIESITLAVGPISQLLCEPLPIRRNPRLTAEAQYSLPFTVATAITKGKPRIEHFTGEGIKDPEILRVSNKVGYRMDDTCDLKYGTGYCPAKIEIKLTDGRTLRAEQQGGRYGHPERPVSKEDLIDKFRECVAYSARPLSAATVDKIIAMIDKLEDVDDVSEIIRLVS